MVLKTTTHTEVVLDWTKDEIDTIINYIKNEERMINEVCVRYGASYSCYDITCTTTTIFINEDIRNYMESQLEGKFWRYMTTPTDELKKEVNDILDKVRENALKWGMYKYIDEYYDAVLGSVDKEVFEGKYGNVEYESKNMKCRLRIGYPGKPYVVDCLDHYKNIYFSDLSNIRSTIKDGAYWKYICMTKELIKNIIDIIHEYVSRDVKSDICDGSKTTVSKTIDYKTSDKYNFIMQKRDSVYHVTITCFDLFTRAKFINLDLAPLEVTHRDIISTAVIYMTINDKADVYSTLVDALET